MSCLLLPLMPLPPLPIYPSTGNFSLSTHIPADNSSDCRVLGAGSSRKQRAPNQETPSMTVMSQGLKAPSSLPLWLENSGVPVLLSFPGAPIGLYPTFPWQRSTSQHSQLASFTSCSHLLHTHSQAASLTSFCCKALSAEATAVMIPQVEDSWRNHRRRFCLNP